MAFSGKENNDIMYMYNNVKDNGNIPFYPSLSENEKESLGISLKPDGK